MVLIMRVILVMELDKAKEAGITVMAVNFMAIGKMIVKMDMVRLCKFNNKNFKAIY